MPIRPPESGDSAVAEQRQVHVLARGTNHLWIDVQGIPWLINYVGAEVALRGVPKQQDDSDAEGNCELKGLRMKYYFADKVWQGDFVEGPLRGKSFSSSVANRTAEKWATVQAAVAKDPEMENWDQSPFHHNEIGSQNARTLALRGSIEVPLVEGHADTRLRWTANLTTFSNKERIERGDFPYAQFMFRAEGERLQERLREHVRSRGYPAWASASTSEKGSYRAEDVLEFLDRHLPPMPQLRKELAAMPQSRGWRIAMADDLASHKTDNVRRLCWQ